MTPKQKSIIAKERRQVRAFLSAIRTESNTISQQLAEIIGNIGKLREAQLAIELVLTRFEKKLGNN